MMYLIVKSVHIIGVVSWFAGLFYLVRLFVYYRETEEKPETDRKVLQPQYSIMMSRLYNIITTPAMVITVVAGTIMLILNPSLFSAPWMIVKLCLIIGLLVYHWYCARIIRHLKNDVILWTSFRFRLFNEVATLFLVAIVFLAIMKNTFDALYGLVGFIVFAIILFAFASWYKIRRQSKLKN